MFIVAVLIFRSGSLCSCTCLIFHTVPHRENQTLLTGTFLPGPNRSNTAEFWRCCLISCWHLRFKPLENIFSKWNLKQRWFHHTLKPLKPYGLEEKHIHKKHTFSKRWWKTTHSKALIQPPSSLPGEVITGSYRDPGSQQYHDPYGDFRQHHGRGSCIPTWFTWSHQPLEKEMMNRTWKSLFSGSIR